MSAHAETESKFPGSTAADLGEVNRGPGPSVLNPAGVYPEGGLTTDPVYAERKETHGSKIATAVENPYEMEQAMQRLHAAIVDVLGIFETEGEASDVANDGTKKAVDLFSHWKKQVEDIQAGRL